MWISKPGETRKQEFIDTALKLFMERGYHKTSINAVIEAVGVTKGAFYYYFKSKEAILEAATDQYAQALAQAVIGIYEDGTLSAVAKIKAGFTRAQQLRESNRERVLALFHFMERDENVLFKRKFFEKTIARIQPAYSRVIEQGVREQSFNTLFPAEAAETIIRLGSRCRTRMMRLFLEKERNPHYRREIREIALYLQDAVERLLGAEKGTFEFEGELLENFLRR